ncbi:hypothetical protein GCM10027347_42400 [Larkinella harenae]
MKKVQKFLVFSFLALVLTNCKKSEVDPPEPSDAQCKLTAIQAQSGDKDEFQYNSAGLISKRTLTLRGSGSSVSVYEYTYQYNASNQVVSASILLNGKVPDHVTDEWTGNRMEFKWTNGKLTEVKDLLGAETLYTTTVRYDNQGRITRFAGMPADPQEFPYEKVYTYEANGKVKFEFIENDLKVGYDEIEYDNAIRSTESLLMTHGLPFDHHRQIPWKSNVLKSVKSYDLDQAGTFRLARDYQVTKVDKNRHNLAIAQTIDEEGKQRSYTFTLSDCE